MYYGEKFNAATHFFGAVLALIGSGVLVMHAVIADDPWKLTSVIIYGITLVLLYSFSTLYHSVRGPAKSLLQKLDHHSIYLLIAGSYTPFCLVTLRHSWGWPLLIVIWSLGILGSLLELRPQSEARIFSVVIYVVMGWAALAAIVPLMNALGSAGFAWLAAGGLLYTVGIIFFVLDTRVKHGHGIWHLFVLGGSSAHYFAILNYVV
ncbi:hemolysin III family protein [Undibacterium sp.]|uniref:PAQR family membrane homeostasis protein TrhA n=1 Tax=Undibacterium sp. TaxID=1914977 RepID=UPI0025FACAA3|nr:hemolysin III family protein [Undibacterium sp.]